MEQALYKKQAIELADLLIENYPNYKYKNKGNLWSFAFFWNGNELSEYSVTNPYKDFIEETFNLSTETIKKPESLIPKTISLVTHFSMLSMANRDLLESLYSQAISGYEKTNKVMEIISDKLLLEEMLGKYITLKEKLDENSDVFDFLLRYDVTKNKIIPKQKPEGSYINLATRLFYRYGEEKLEESIFKIVNPELAAKAREFHSSAQSTENAPIEEELLTLGAKYGNGSLANLIKPETATKVSIPGPRRVKINGSQITINWQAMAETRRRRVLSYRAFNPKEIILARVERTLTETYLNLYKQQGVGVLEDIDNKLSSASPHEREVLSKVRRKFEIMGKFQDFNINHNMPVTIIRQGE